MNILYCGDANIADGVIISALSLLKNTTEQLNIYILTASASNDTRRFYPLKQSFAKALEQKVKEYNENNSVTLFDITELFEKEPPTANIDTRFTPCCMLRLYADLVSELPDKILYLDNDVICRKDPYEFYARDISDSELMGSLDYYGSWFFRKNVFKRDYLNSGVLLLNLKEIRRTGLFCRCRRRCAQKEMFMPDQSAINKLSTTKSIAPRRFNEQRKLREDTVFQHFTTSFRFFPWFHTVSVKPWNIDGLHNTLSIYEYDDILADFKILKETLEATRA